MHLLIIYLSTVCSSICLYYLNEPNPKITNITLSKKVLTVMILLLICNMFLVLWYKTRFHGRKRSLFYNTITCRCLLGNILKSRSDIKHENLLRPNNKEDRSDLQCSIHLDECLSPLCRQGLTSNTSTITLIWKPPSAKEELRTQIQAHVRSGMIGYVWFLSWEFKANMHSSQNMNISCFHLFLVACHFLNTLNNNCTGCFKVQYVFYVQLQYSYIHYSKVWGQ